MEAEDGEFQDWEVLHNISDTEVEESSDFVGDSGGMIQVNYFSLDSQKKHIVSDDSEVSSKTSDNPSWIDPGFETQYPRKHSAEGWSESSSDQCDERRLIEFEGKFDVGFVQNDQNGKFHDGVGGVEVMNGENDKNSSTGRLNDERFSEFEGILDVGFVQNDKNGNFKDGFDGVEHVIAENDGNLENILDDSSGISYGETIVEGVRGSGECKKGDGISVGENGERVASDEKGETEVRKVEEKRKKSGVDRVVWWKLPIELLRYCVFRGPVWTLSVAAALMGFVLLGRRMYMKKKKKSRTLGSKIPMDDKKISQFVSRAARLNEAFSVVKRVPIIRPSLPSGGLTPWSVASLR
ncbi:hypothetical protein Leryth_004472 [Lithospermum erythrorhizon]|nr:hypothetical protein Leryth_004472 [Lithospermum erythrorhizon]